MTGVPIGEAAGEGFDLIRRHPTSILSRGQASVTPVLIVVGVISISITGAFLAIMSAPWARIYRDLAQPDVAATFA